MAVVITVASDQHCGSTVGLISDKPITYDDGGSYLPSPGQLWLWDAWRSGWDKAAECAARNNADLWFVNNGDLTDGPRHHGTHQSVGLHIQEREIVRDVLDYPLLLDQTIKRIFIVRGTESHVGPGAASEEGIAKALSDDWPVEGCPEPRTMSWYHLMMDVEGVFLDFLHHGRTGYRPWTHWNATNLLAAQIVMERIKNDERIPDLAIRSHFHRHSDSHDAQKTRVIQTPALQLATSYVYRRVPESLADVGMIWILVDDGHYEVYKDLHVPSRGPVWTAA